MEHPAKIKILPNGPYVVTGGIPLYEQIIMPKGRGFEWKEGRELPQAETYVLCRCGKSRNAPFCDASHTALRFSGLETASKDDYETRAMKIRGPALDLLDDGRCAFARFCHRETGDAWELTAQSYLDHSKSEAIHAACECPSGRLTAMEKSGQLWEPEFEAAIIIVQDPSIGVSGGIYVTGNVVIESSDGSFYESRNRAILCRCGHSSNKPFCDASHVSTGYKDHKDEE